MPRMSKTAACIALMAVSFAAGRSHAQPAPASCDEKVAEFKAWVATYPKSGNVLRFHDVQDDGPPDPNLVAREGRSFEQNDAAASVEMFNQGFRIVGDGTRVEDLAALRPLLREAVQLRRAGPAPSPLVLAIDRDRRWSDIVGLVNAAADAGFTQVDFVFQRSFAIKPPPSAVDKEVQRILAAESFQRGRLVAIEIDRSLKKCKGGSDVMGHLANVDSREKSKLFAGEMPPVLRACNCAATPRDLMALWWTLGDPDKEGVIHREFIGARLTVAKGKPGGTTLKAKKDARWSETSALVANASNDGAPPLVRFEVSAR
jgi:biopolymer transport protein ExbD